MKICCIADAADERLAIACGADSLCFVSEMSDAPVFFTGGLGAANVDAAIEAVRPFGADVCSRVRTNGVLEEAKLAAFFAAVSERG